MHELKKDHDGKNDYAWLFKQKVISNKRFYKRIRKIANLK